MSSPTILILNIPTKTFIGIDFASFNSAPNFHGIKDISQGLHFVYTGTDASLSIRQGRWLRFAAQTIHVLTWNADLEHLDLVDANSQAAQQACAKLPELQSRGLVEYNALLDASANLQKEQANDTEDNVAESVLTAWHQLVSHITPRLINRITSDIPGVFSSVSSAPQDTDTIPGLTHEEAMSELASAGMLHFQSIDLRQTWPDDAIGRDRTLMARDRSWYLRKLIGDQDLPQQQAASQLIGEVQFCFLGVLCLANYSCLEQWKRILSIVFTCREALNEVEGFFTEVVNVLRAQLGRVEDVEGGLFEMGDEFESRWLRQLLRTFRGNVEDIVGQQKDSKLIQELDGLESWLRDRYGWSDDKNVVRKGMIQLEDGEMVEMDLNDADEEEETGEYAPVVVDM